MKAVHIKDALPAYAAGSLGGADRDRVRAHLAECSGCREDLTAWQALAGAAAPDGHAPDGARIVHAVLARSALAEPTGLPPNRQPTKRLRHVAALLLAEARLIRLAVPLASALVMGLGVAIVLLQTATGGELRGDTAERVADAGGIGNLALALIAPIVAAAGVAGTYRSQRDPGAELVAATPTSDRLLLLVRLTLVFGYDLVLAVAASAALAAVDASETSLNALVTAWLGPMALLSALSLLVAVRFGPEIALGAAVALWAIRVLAGTVVTPDEWPARFIVEIWSTNAPVLAVSAAVAVAAVALAGRVGAFSDEPTPSPRATH